MSDGNTGRAEQPAVRTTIVGGRPPGCGKGIGDIPRGIEVLVKKAAVDPQFRTLLLTARAAAADEIGLTLQPEEAQLLSLVPATQLEAIIARTKVDPSKRAAFLGRAAAVMLVALGAGTMSTTSARSDEPPAKPDQGQVIVAGVVADTVVEQPDQEPLTPRIGTRPRLPVSQPASQPASQPTSQPASQPASQPDLRPIEPPMLPMAGAVLRPLPRGPVEEPASQPATSQPTTQPTPAVKALIDKLDDENWKTRDQAHKDLVALMPEIKPQLLHALKEGKLTAEQRVRIQTIVDQFTPQRPEEIKAVRGNRVVNGIRAL